MKLPFLENNEIYIKGEFVQIREFTLVIISVIFIQKWWFRLENENFVIFRNSAYGLRNLAEMAESNRLTIRADSTKNNEHTCSRIVWSNIHCWKTAIRTCFRSDCLVRASGKWGTWILVSPELATLWYYFWFGIFCHWNKCISLSKLWVIQIL